MKTATLTSVGLWLAIAASLALAQSLGDVARELRQKRAKEAKHPTKVYTNDNLPARPPSEGPTAASSIAETPKAATYPTEPATPSAESSSAETPHGTSEDKKKTREHWQEHFTAARQSIAAAEELQRLSEDELSLLQIQKARELSADVQAELDTKIKAATAEVEAKRAATAKARKALEELEKEFKESGAPAEWSQKSGA